MDKNNLEKALHIVINREHKYTDKTFRQASPILWNEIVTRANKINAVKSDEMTSTLFSRLLNRRKQPFQPIANPNAYIYTALKNIQKDMWRAEKRASGYTDELGEYHQHRSLDEFVADSTQRLHEKIATPLTPSTDENEELKLSALKEMIRLHLFNVEIKEVKSKTTKGEQSFLQAAEKFQEYAEGTHKVEDGAPYKKFDRQRIFMVEHLKSKIPSTESVATQFILEFAERNELTRKRELRIEEAKADEKMNVEIVHRQIEAEIAVRSLFDYITNHGNRRDCTIQDLLGNPVTNGILRHCQYHIFKLDMFRTKKRRKGSLESMYCKNVHVS